MTDLDDFTHLIRFDSLYDLFWFDDKKNNPNGLGRNSMYGPDLMNKYFDERWVITPEKQELLDKAQKDLQTDTSFLDLMHKQKTNKRKLEKNKFVGNFQVIPYSRQEDKIFTKQIPGKRRASLNIAIQPGILFNGEYSESFFAILKLLLSLQQLNVSCNVDFFDSDTTAIDNEQSFVIANIFNSRQKFDIKAILCCSHQQFFDISLFNGYSASKKQKQIGTFLDIDVIEKYLSPYYDIIAGNHLHCGDNNELSYGKMIDTVIKIIHE